MKTYIGFGCESGNNIPEDEALDYALERCGVSIDPDAPDALALIEAADEMKKDFVDWFYSGNWYLEDEEI